MKLRSRAKYGPATWRAGETGSLEPALRGVYREEVCRNGVPLEDLINDGNLGW
jgi:hypothetical protein